jgi:GNAT superfamily N-acetyltransferase
MKANTTIEVNTEVKSGISLLAQELESLGYRTEWTRLPNGELNPNAFKMENSWYTTILSPDGAVRVALDNRFLFFNPEKRRVYVDRLGTPILVVLAAVVTLPKYRRQGKATKVLLDILAVARKAKIPLQGLPDQMSEYVSKANPGPSREKLLKWYQRLGFTIQDGVLITNEFRAE